MNMLSMRSVKKAVVVFWNAFSVIYMNGNTANLQDTGGDYMYVLPYNFNFKKTSVLNGHQFTSVKQCETYGQSICQ